MATDMLYPIPSMKTFPKVLEWINTLTHGLFWVFSCMALFFTLFFALKNYSTPKAIGTASFVTAIYAIGLRMIGLVSTLYMVLFIVLSAGSLVYLAIAGDSQA